MSSSAKLRVVLTASICQCVHNDDGPPHRESPYIFGLYQHLTKDLGFDVKVVIPSSQKSWIGKAYQIKDIIKGNYYYPREPDGHGEISTASRPLQEGEVAEWILLDATPASCSNIAVHNLYPGQVDLLISGPNYGRNTSSAFSLSSGTIGAALSSSLSNIRSVALSYGTMIHPVPKSFEQPAHKLSGQIIKYLIENWGRRDVLYSINVPMIHNLLNDEGLKIYWTSIWRNNYGSLFKEASSSKIDGNVFQGTDAETNMSKVVEEGMEEHKLVFKFSPRLDGILTAQDATPGSDAWTISNNAVSVTALQPCFAEMPVEDFRTVEDRIWKMKL